MSLNVRSYWRNLNVITQFLVSPRHSFSIWPSLRSFKLDHLNFCTKRKKIFSCLTCVKKKNQHNKKYNISACLTFGYIQYINEYCSVCCYPELFLLGTQLNASYIHCTCTKLWLPSTLRLVLTCWLKLILNAFFAHQKERRDIFLSTLCPGSHVNRSKLATNK